MNVLWLSRIYQSNSPLFKATYEMKIHRWNQKNPLNNGLFFPHEVPSCVKILYKPNSFHSQCKVVKTVKGSNNVLILPALKWAVDSCCYFISVPWHWIQCYSQLPQGGLCVGEGRDRGCISLYNCPVCLCVYMYTCACGHTRIKNGLLLFEHGLQRLMHLQ